MSSGREIITLQFGNYSNFVGAHWWNIQESSFDYENQNPDITHDVLFREGQNFRGDVTYTPRLLLVDLKGSLSNENVVGDLYQDIRHESKILWDQSKVEKKMEERDIEKHEFRKDLDLIDEGQPIAIDDKDYKFNETVEYWCDFLRTRLHPRSVNVVNEYTYQSSTKSFDVFHLGIGVYNEREFQEEYENRIRHYLEECDNLDGFQLIVDSDNGFGGLASTVLKALEDEYPNKTKLVYSLIPNSYDDQTPVKDVTRMINIGLSFQQLSEFSSLCVPLSTNKTCWRGYKNPVRFPNLVYQQSYYETSSIIASLLDTISIRFRASDKYVSLNDITTSLSVYGRRLAAGSLGLPFPVSPESYLLDTLEKMDESLWTGLSPVCDIQDDRVWIQNVVLRGITNSKLRNPKLHFEGSNPAYTCTNIQEMLSLFLSFCSYATMSGVSTIESPMKTDVPFPQIFSPSVSRIGSVDLNSQRVLGFKVKSVPVIAGLHSCKSLGDMLQDLSDNVKKIKIKRFPQMIETNMDEDEYNECFEKLQALRQCYSEEFDV